MKRTAIGLLAVFITCSLTAQSLDTLAKAALETDDQYTILLNELKQKQLRIGLLIEGSPALLSATAGNPGINFTWLWSEETGPVSPLTVTGAPEVSLQDSDSLLSKIGLSAPFTLDVDNFDASKITPAISISLDLDPEKRLSAVSDPDKLLDRSQFLTMAREADPDNLKDLIELYTILRSVQQREQAVLQNVLASAKGLIQSKASFVKAERAFAAAADERDEAVQLQKYPEGSTQMERLNLNIRIAERSMKAAEDVFLNRLSNFEALTGTRPDNVEEFFTSPGWGTVFEEAETLARTVTQSGYDIPLTESRLQAELDVLRQQRALEALNDPIEKDTHLTGSVKLPVFTDSIEKPQVNVGVSGTPGSKSILPAQLAWGLTAGIDLEQEQISFGVSLSWKQINKHQEDVQRAVQLLSIENAEIRLMQAVEGDSESIDLMMAQGEELLSGFDLDKEDLALTLREAAETGELVEKGIVNESSLEKKQDSLADLQWNLMQTRLDLLIWYRDFINSW